jgi:type VI secretion system secreted protein Hcp
MAVSAYLYIDGIDGPSTFKEKHIDIVQFSWRVNQTNVYGAKSYDKEAKAGRAFFDGLQVSKVLDKTSPLLFDHCATGNILKEVYILYGKWDGDQQVDYFRIYLKDAQVTHVTLLGRGENPQESVTFAFEAVEVAYKPETDLGTLGAAIPKGYDLAKLTPDFAGTFF